MSDLVEKMVHAFGGDIQIKQDAVPPDRGIGVSLSYGTRDKLSRYLNWEPKIPLEKSIEKMIQYDPSHSIKQII